MGLSFGRRVSLAVTLGLKSEHAPALSALGALRNTFAHRLDAQLSEERVNNLYASLSAGDKEIVQLAYARTNLQMGRLDAPPLERLSPKERFIIISVALRTMLMTAMNEIRTRRQFGESASQP